MKIRFTGIVCVILCLVSITAFLPIQKVQASVDSEYDYSACSDPDYKKSLDAATVSDLLNLRLTSEEKEYISEYCGTKWLYGINNGKDDSERFGIDVKDTLDGGSEVVARFVTLKANNGAELYCTPAFVKIEDGEVPFTKDGDVYKCRLANKRNKVDIQYSIVTSVPSVQANSLANFAYDAATYAGNAQSDYSVYLRRKQAYERYLCDLAEYNNAKEAYKAYSEYLKKKQAYDDYVEQKAQYDLRSAAYAEAYEEYEKAYSEYIKAQSNYGAQLNEYYNYLNRLEAYEKEMESYNAYSKVMELVNYRISSMDTIFTKMTSLKRDVYSAVTGKSVTAVLDAFLENAAGMEGLVGKEVVDVAAKAKNSTIIVREIFADYKELKTDEQKYGYYCANYDRIVSEICRLTSYLEFFWQNSKVRRLVRTYNNGDDPKDVKYVILVAQLIVISNLLSDEPLKSYDGKRTLDMDTKILYEKFNPDYKKFELTLKEILENELTPYAATESQTLTIVNSDTNKAKPSSNEQTIPAEVKKPEKPAEVKKPSEPVCPVPPVDNRGLEPMEVEKPTEVEQVDEPNNPPQEVEDPSKDIAATKRFNTLHKVVEQVRNGVITKRSYDKGLQITLTDTVVYSKENITVNVKFNYNDNGGAAVSTTKSVTPFDPESKYAFTPNGYKDAEHEYTFDKWTYKDGKAVDFSHITEGKNDGDAVEVFAKYNAVKRKYKITFKFGSDEFLPENIKNAVISAEDVEYGSVPNIPLPQIEDDDDYMYAFSGYDKDVVAVTGEAEYVAVVIRRPIAYVVENNEPFSIIKDGNYKIKTEISLLESVKRIDVVVFDAAVRAAKNEMSLTVSFADFAITLGKEQIKEVAAQKYGAILSVNILVSTVGGSNKYTFITSLKNTNGGAILRQNGDAITFTACADNVDVKSQGGALVLLDGNDNEIGSNDFSYNSQEKSLNYRASMGVCVFFVRYAVSCDEKQDGAIKCDAVNACAGDKILYTIEEKEGYKCTVFYYNGDKKVIVRNGEFYMPACNVSLMCEYTIIMYTVTFSYVRNGEKVVLSTAQYPYGSVFGVEIVIPTPSKYSDDSNTYTFSKWEGDDSTLNSDREFIAVFESVPKQKEEIKKGGLFSGYMLYVSVGGICILVICIAALAFIVVKRKKNKTKAEANLRKEHLPNTKISK